MASAAEWAPPVDQGPASSSPNGKQYHKPEPSYSAPSGLTEITTDPGEPSQSFPFLGSSFHPKVPMLLLGKCIQGRNPRPPLILGHIGRINVEDEEKFAASPPPAPLLPWVVAQALLPVRLHGKHGIAPRPCYRHPARMEAHG